MTHLLRKTLAGFVTLGIAATFLATPVSFTVAGLTVTSGPDVAYARRGADDGPNHDAGDDHGGRNGGRGRGRGADDGPNHTSIDASGSIVTARRGADDGANHDRGSGRGRGRGADDPVGHR